MSSEFKTVAMDDLVQSMHRTPEEVKAGITVGTDISTGIPISSAEMRGEPVFIEVGEVKFFVKPLSRKSTRAFNTLLFSWPLEFQYAALVRDPTQYPIDYEATASLLRGYLLRVHKLAIDEGETQRALGKEHRVPLAPELPTAESVAEFVSQIAYYGLGDETEHAIIRTVRLFTDPLHPSFLHVPQMTPAAQGEWETLRDSETVDLLGDLEDAQLPMLLRLLMQSNGRFKGCLSDRVYFRSNGSTQLQHSKL